MTDRPVLIFHDGNLVGVLTACYGVASNFAGEVIVHKASAVGKTEMLIADIARDRVEIVFLKGEIAPGGFADFPRLVKERTPPDWERRYGARHGQKRSRPR